MEKSSSETVLLAVSPKKAAVIIDVGLTRLYQLINSGEIASFRDGKSRKILFSSLEAYVARHAAAEVNRAKSEWTKRATAARLKNKNRTVRKSHGGS